MHLKLRTRVAQLAGIVRIVPCTLYYRYIKVAATSSQPAVVADRVGCVHDDVYDSALFPKLANPVLEADPSGWSRLLKRPGCAWAFTSSCMKRSVNNLPGS